MGLTQENKIKRERRARRTRAVIFGTASMPRFSVFESNKHLYCQFIDDILGKTLCSASDFEVKKKKGKQHVAIEDAKELGKLAAKKASQLGIKTVVFDRGHRKYHGRIKALAEGAREEGLIF